MQVVAAAIKDATTLLSVMKVGTISVLAAAALMPVRNGFSWDPASKSFQIDPALRQVCTWPSFISPMPGPGGGVRIEVADGSQQGLFRHAVHSLAAPMDYH